MNNQEKSTGNMKIRGYPIAEPKDNVLGTTFTALDTPLGNAARENRIMSGQNGPFEGIKQAKEKPAPGPANNAGPDR